MSIRYLTLTGWFSPDALLIRSAIYCCLLLSWAFSLKRRIIQIQVRRYLLAIAALMMLWMLLKTVKHAVSDLNLMRHLWYCYYLPMLFIPQTALFVSMSLGRPENYRLPQWTKLMYVPSLILFIIVLTNDLHQAVFSFPSGIMSDALYRYEPIYYVILLWIALCAFASLFVMLAKCRAAHSKTVLVLPLLPLILSFAYTEAYISGSRLVLLLAGDMTITHCLLIYAVFEACIRCGLIQSNMGYDELLAITSLPVQITDEDFCTKYVSGAMQKPLAQDELLWLPPDYAALDRDTVLKRHQISRGWVFWTEDISMINELQRELELTRDELHDTGNILEAENAQRAKMLRLAEENRLYDMMEAQTKEQIALLRRLLTELQDTESLEHAERILGQIIIIGTYIKRRNNLIFVGSQRGAISAQELRLCLNESVENLILYGIACKAVVRGEGELACEQAAFVYDLFEAIVEAGLDTLDSLLVSVEVSCDVPSKEAAVSGDDINEASLRHGDFSADKLAGMCDAPASDKLPQHGIFDMNDHADIPVSSINEELLSNMTLHVNMCASGLTPLSLEHIKEHFPELHCEQDEDELWYLSLK